MTKLTLQTTNSSSIAKELMKFKNKSIEKKVQKKRYKKKKLLMSKDKYQEIFNHFNNKYPKCFKTEVAPLKIGIHEDLWRNDLDDKITKTVIRKFLHIYSHKKDYKKSMVLGANRIDLNGDIVSSVTEKEIEYILFKQKNNKKIKNDNNHKDK